jgi:hypothetical protein
VTKMDWLTVLDLSQAIDNVRSEFPGDWHRDPWGWPELGFIKAKKPDSFVNNCASTGSRQVAVIDVPKDNWGVRPAMVLDLIDRITYQALVDRLSVGLIGTLTPNAFGWRLRAINPQPGVYSRNDKQWKGYRGHLKFLVPAYEVALKTDIVACFASIPLGVVRSEIEARSPAGAIVSRLVSLLDGLETVPGRSGLPQRSIASAVLANMVLGPLDDVLAHYSKRITFSFLKENIKYDSYARWMDDIWLFHHDAGTLRKAQIDLQQTAHSIGLQLNSAKTELLEGEQVAERALEVEHSAVDDALLTDQNNQPLEELIDKLLEHPDTASRTSLKFVSTRMRSNDITYRLPDLLGVAERMPHAADTLAPLFKANFVNEELQDWFIEYVNSDWSAFEWSVAQFGRMFPSSKPPKREVKEYFAQAVADANRSLPMHALACQRLVEWDPQEARAIIRSGIQRANNAHARRVIALAALKAQEQRPTIRQWLAQMSENDITKQMLDEYNFRPPKVVADYAN